MTWTQKEADAYQSAIDTIDTMVAIRSAGLGDEEKKENPAQEKIKQWMAESVELGNERYKLGMKDHAAIKAVIEKYTPIIREDRGLPPIDMDQLFERIGIKN